MTPLAISARSNLLLQHCYDILSEIAACAVQNMMNGLVEKSRGHMSAIASIESLVPDSPQRTVSVHEGGAYALAFDRLMSSPSS